MRNFIDNSLIFNISIVNDKLIHIYFITTRSLFVIHVYISTPLKHQIHQNYQPLNLPFSKKRRKKKNKVTKRKKRAEFLTISPSFRN